MPVPTICLQNLGVRVAQNPAKSALYDFILGALVILFVREKKLQDTGNTETLLIAIHAIPNNPRTLVHQGNFLRLHSSFFTCCCLQT